jgi:Spy/CpxP family protein refolding chaperone
MQENEFISLTLKKENIMKKKNIILASVVAVTLLASSSVMAFAATDTTTRSGFNGLGFGMHRSNISSNLTDAELAQLRADCPVNLTEAQRDALHVNRVDMMKSAVEQLVSKDIITQAEADAIVADMPTAPPVNPPVARTDRGNDSVQALTVAQRTALQTEMKALQAANLKALVDDGTLTQAQADQMLLRGTGMMNGNGQGRGPGMMNGNGNGYGPGMNCSQVVDNDNN